MKYFVTPDEDRRLDAAARRTLRGSYLELSDGVTHYELSGPEDGELVLLFGALTIPLFYWDDFASELHTRGYRTLAYSTYGRGYSDRADADYDEALFVRQVSELTERLGIVGPYHVVGASMGGLIAMAYAGQHAESVMTLTLVGPAGLAAQPMPEWLLRRDTIASVVAKGAGRKLLDQHLGREVRDPDRAVEIAAMINDAYRYEGSMYSLISTLQQFPMAGRAELYERTGKLGLPAMLVWGAEDQVIPVVHLDEARELLGPVRSEVIDECGHMVPFERPADLADQFASFAGSRS